MIRSGHSAVGGGVGLGGLTAGSFLSTIAGPVIGSMIAQQFFSNEIGFDAGGVDSGHPSGLDIKTPATMIKYE